MHLSLLVTNGVDIRTVADRAGHSDTVRTMRLHAHALAAQGKRASERQGVCREIVDGVTSRDSDDVCRCCVV